MDIIAWLQDLQRSRNIEYITSCGDTLLFRRLSAQQKLGRPFRFELDFLMLSPDCTGATAWSAGRGALIAARPTGYGKGR